MGRRTCLTCSNACLKTNTVLYTTHLASLIDPSFPERIRIAEVSNHHANVIDGIVSSQHGPMAVIEARLGLNGEHSSLLGNRQTLVVEGGTDLIIINKPNALLGTEGKGMSPRIYMWPAETVSQDANVRRLHRWHGLGWRRIVGKSHDAEKKAGTKIKELDLKDVAQRQRTAFRVLHIAKAAGVSRGKTKPRSRAASRMIRPRPRADRLPDPTLNSSTCQLMAAA